MHKIITIVAIMLIQQSSQILILNLLELNKKTCREGRRVLFLTLVSFNRPHLVVYQYYQMAPRLSGQTSIFGVVVFLIQVSYGN